MISARRCSIVMRRAYWLISFFEAGVVFVGDDDRGGVPAETGDDELAGGPFPIL
jgi:hypothetical protein